jgi:predicted RNase H-like HicB family nuclease
MKYTVIITEAPNGDLHATVPGIPECHVHARTRSDAIQAVRHSIAQVLSRSEIVQIDVPTSPKSEHAIQDTPWELFGTFRDDATWGSLFDDIERQRTDEMSF